MACKNCKDCNDNGCTPIVYPDCIITKKKYPCLGLNKVGMTGAQFFDAVELACNSWGGGNLTFNNAITKTGTLVQLGGPLIKDTAVTWTVASGFALAMIMGDASNNNYGLTIDPVGGGPGVPAAALGVVNSISGDSAIASGVIVAGNYIFALNTQNGANIARVVVSNVQSLLYFSPDNGTTVAHVRARSTGLEFRGTGNPSVCTTTQIQENQNIAIASAAVLAINTNANAFLVSGAVTISDISITNIQAGTLITLEFTDSPAPLITHGDAIPPAGSAAIFLNGCVSWQTRQYDTLTLRYDGTRWNEIGRKACFIGVETWKTMTSASFGQMINGENIPAYSGSVNPATFARLRHQDERHVEIQFIGTVDVGILGAVTLFTLPATAVNIAYRPLVAVWYPVTGMNTTTGLPWIGVLQVNPGGAVTLAISSVIPSGTEAHDFSFCVSVPID